MFVLVDLFEAIMLWFWLWLQLWWLANVVVLKGKLVA
jgi:hypothetical protein